MIKKAWIVMNKVIFKSILFSILVSIAVVQGMALAEQPTKKTDIYAGHYSREGNNASPSRTTHSNIYIKLFKDQWIITLHIPYPSATTVTPDTVDKVFEQIKKQTKTRAYVRGTYGQLAEPATAEVEKYGYVEDKIIYECGSLAPCTIKLYDGYLELIKPGVINEHIIKFNHVVNQ
jgi:hypothetical protein